MDCLPQAARKYTVIDQIQTINSSQIFICTVVRAELMTGAYKSREICHELNLVEQLLLMFPSLSFDQKSADIYGKLRAKLEKSGLPIGGNDLMIAAIALANDLTLITHNTAEFSRIVGLRLEDWQ